MEANTAVEGPRKALPAAGIGVGYVPEGLPPPSLGVLIMKRVMISVLVAVALLTSGVVTSQFGHGWVGAAYAMGDGGDM